MSDTHRHFDAVVIGAGHNGLAAAAYLARAGRSVAVVEATAHPGGATSSTEVFPGTGVRLSRYSYLVSLLPDPVVAELGLNLALATRPVASCTPANGTSLLVHPDPAATERSFTNSGHASSWPGYRDLSADLADLARAVAPGLLGPLPSRGELAAGHPLMARLLNEPVSEVLAGYGMDDLVAGLVATDALIGTHVSLHDPTGVAGACFLYHHIGNGTGTWRLPVGGMGQLVTELVRVATAHGANVSCGIPATAVDADGRTAQVTLADGTRWSCDWVLHAASPQVLDRLRGRSPRVVRDGAQVKINMVLSDLPVPADGTDPRLAFAGTFHVNESLSDLELAWRRSAARMDPGRLPFEVYCHTLTDGSILTDPAQCQSWHTLTLFGLHTPASMFDNDNDAVRTELTGRYLDALDAHLAGPIRDLIVDVGDGPCIEALTPLDLERTLALPRGNIFHGELTMPHGDDDDPPGTWGCSTRADDPGNILLAGAGARRGGGVSCLAGRAAAMHVLSPAAS